AAYLSVQVLDDVRRANAIDDLTVMLGRYGAVVDALQDERRVSRDLSRRVEINGARKATNEQLELLEEAIETLDYDLLDPALRDIVEDSQRNHDDLRDFRRGTVDSGAGLAVMEAGYGDIIATETRIAALMGNTLTDRSLGAHLDAYTGVSLAIESLERERLVGNTIFTTRDDAELQRQYREMGSQNIAGDN